MTGFNFAPTGWQLCAGQLLPISQYAALFSLLGTYYGGDGQTTFGLPDLRGRVPINQGQGPGLSPYTIGEASGSENVTLIPTQIPAHNHPLNASSANANQTSPTGSFLAVAQDSTLSAIPIYNASAGGLTQLNPQSIGMAGGSQPHTNIQPFLCVNFIIAFVGIFPSRG